MIFHINMYCILRNRMLQLENSKTIWHNKGHRRHVWETNRTIRESVAIPYFLDWYVCIFVSESILIIRLRTIRSGKYAIEEGVFNYERCLRNDSKTKSVRCGIIQPTKLHNLMTTTMPTLGGDRPLSRGERKRRKTEQPNQGGPTISNPDIDDYWDLRPRLVESTSDNGDLCLHQPAAQFHRSFRRHTSTWCLAPEQTSIIRTKISSKICGMDRILTDNSWTMDGSAN